MGQLARAHCSTKPVLWPDAGKPTRACSFPRRVHPLPLSGRCSSFEAGAQSWHLVSPSLSPKLGRLEDARPKCWAAEGCTARGRNCDCLCCRVPTNVQGGCHGPMAEKVTAQASPSESHPQKDRAPTGPRSRHIYKKCHGCLPFAVGATLCAYVCVRVSVCV